MFIYAVTAVESGTRALQYLGLDGERASVGFNVRKLGLLCSYVYIFFLNYVWLQRECGKGEEKKEKFLGLFLFLDFLRNSTKYSSSFLYMSNCDNHC